MRTIGSGINIIFVLLIMVVGFQLFWQLKLVSQSRTFVSEIQNEIDGGVENSDLRDTLKLPKIISPPVNSNSEATVTNLNKNDLSVESFLKELIRKDSTTVKSLSTMMTTTFDPRSIFHQKTKHLWNADECEEIITFPENYSEGRSSASNVKYMLLDGPGRLGNVMFQYASLIGIARRNGFTPVIRESNNLASVFEISHTTGMALTNYLNLVERASSRYDECLERVPNVTSYRLIGYYQSWKYFKNVEREVREEFSFRKYIQREVWTFFNKSELANKTTIGVHIRKGDMDLGVLIEKGYTTATAEYFRLAMNYFRKKFSDVIFIVCSDTMPWARQNVVGHDVIYYHYDARTDLAVLAHCKHTIMSTGSYSWWAAWLAGGETIYYSNFPAKNSWLETQYKSEDFFLPHWKGIDA